MAGKWATSMASQHRHILQFPSFNTLHTKPFNAQHYFSASLMWRSTPDWLSQAGSRSHLCSTRFAPCPNIRREKKRKYSFCTSQQVCLADHCNHIIHWYQGDNGLEIRGKKERKEIVQRLETQGENFHSTKSVLALPPPFYNQNINLGSPYVYKLPPGWPGL